MALDPVTAITDLLNGVGGKLIDRLWPDPAQAQEAKLKLAEMAQNGELAKMASEADLTKAMLADTQSARARESAIATSASAPLFNKLITPLLAVGIVTLTFGLFVVMVFVSDGQLSDSQERILIFVVGAAVPICTQVVSYYFGSSRGDAANAQHLRDIMKNGS